MIKNDNAGQKSLKVKKQVGYLSGAPRVSTRPEAAASGPRAHVLGVMNAFKQLGWEVKPFIVGNRVPDSWVTQGSENALRSSWLIRLVADIFRLFMILFNGWQSVREL